MNRSEIFSARIHPAIGVARVGNSLEAGFEGTFIGPEVLTPPLRLPGFFRDRFGRLKRQSARFRIFAYAKDGSALGELTQKLPDVSIKWTVHLVNKKAAWYDFDIALDLPEAAGMKSPRRNAQVQGTDRQKLVIDSGACSITGLGSRSPDLMGKFFDTDVYLGELHTDDLGRLIVLGGRGKSGTPFDNLNPPSTFANNPGWYDDTADGPVTAELWIDGTKVGVESAWVVTTPPNYAPDLVANQTMYDVIADTMSGLFNTSNDAAPPPSFTNDILPLFRHLVDAQWLSAGYLAQFGWKGIIDFGRPEFLLALSKAPRQDPADPSRKIDRFQEFRRLILNRFRDPHATAFEPLKWPPVFGDAYGGPQTVPSPRVGFAVTKTVFAALTQWSQGNFVNDYNPLAADPACLEDVPLSLQPSTLDKAALSFCMGGPFHPGIEMTWPMRIGSMYKGLFRLRQRADDCPEPDYGEFLTPEIALSRGGPLSASGPGDLTKWMGVPWQTDAASCRSGFSGEEFPNDPYLPAFWVSRLPSQVLTEDSFFTITSEAASVDAETKLAAFESREDWLRSLKPDGPYVELLTRMIVEFGQLGIVERRELEEPIAGLPAVMYVENLPAGTKPVGEKASLELNKQLRKARFAHLQR